MRRALLIALPICFVLAAVTLIGMVRADSTNPLRRIAPYVSYQQTYYSPSMSGQKDASVQVWAWLAPKSDSEMAHFKRELELEGWAVYGGPPQFEAIKGSLSPSTILPQYRLEVRREYLKDSLVVVYTRQLTPFQSLFYRYSYRHLDYNSPPPSKPLGLGCLGP